MSSDDDLQAYFQERRPDLVRFATLQLRDPAAAEDAVQETLLAALRGAAQFDGRSSPKTWLFAILKRKIIDLLRTRRREVPASQLANADDGEDDHDPLFDARGFWATEHHPHRWTHPEESLERQQFWTIFEMCLNHLPERTAQVFSMRELLGLETEEICQELRISTSNCWVILHRARMGLRLCLEQRWFAST